MIRSVLQDLRVWIGLEDADLIQVPYGKRLLIPCWLWPISDDNGDIVWTSMTLTLDNHDPK